MQFLNQNPAIAAFQTGTKLGADERRMEDEALRSRLTFENQLVTLRNQQLADKAMREGIAATYAQPPAPQPAAAAPAARAAPAPSYVPIAPDTGGDTEIGPVAMAAPTPAAVAPAAPAPAAPRPGSQFAPLMSRLAEAPGTGASMLNLFSTDIRSRATTAEAERRWQTEGFKEFMEAIKGGHLGVADTINQRFGLNFPKEAYQNPTVIQSMQRLGGVAAVALKGNEDLLPDFIKNAMHLLNQAQAGGMPYDQAINAAASEALTQIQTGGRFKVKSYMPSEGGEVVGFGERPGQVHKTGIKARKTATEVRIDAGLGAGGSGGGGSKQAEYARYAIAALVAQGIPEAQATQAVILRQKFAVDAPTRAKMIMGLVKARDARDRPLYDVNTAASLIDSIVELKPAAGAAPGPVPAPAAGKRRSLDELLPIPKK